MENILGTEYYTVCESRDTEYRFRKKVVAEIDDPEILRNLGAGSLLRRAA